MTKLGVQTSSCDATDAGVPLSSDDIFFGGLQSTNWVKPENINESQLSRMAIVLVALSWVGFLFSAVFVTLCLGTYTASDFIYLF